jgi:hypothetical protein
MHMQRLFLGTFLSLMALLLISCGTVTPTTAQEKRDRSLYERLGRYDAIAAVVDDFCGSSVRGGRWPVHLYRAQHEDVACGTKYHRSRLAGSWNPLSSLTG